MKLKIIAAAALAAPLAALADVATGTWTTGTWTDFTPAENNLLRPRYLARDASNNDSDVVYCDGSVLNPWSQELKNDRVVTWEFPSAATVYGARFYTSWGNEGRVDIEITSIDVMHSGGAEWTSLENSEVSHVHETSQNALYAQFAAADETSPIATDVVALRFVFKPKQQNNGVGYLEMEVLGELSEPDPGPEKSDYEWTAGGFDHSEWEPLVAESNMMKYCSSILKGSTDVTVKYAGMVDKSIATYEADVPWINHGNTMTWKFSNPINLQSFSVFAGWDKNYGNSGRDSVTVQVFETLGEDGVWTKHFGVQDEENWCVVGSPIAGIDTATAKAGENYGTLRRKDGKPLATDVCGIRILSLLGDGDGACWLEVEAEGWIEPTNAIFDDTDSSVTFANDCWDATWTAKLVSLGASEEVEVNLWTSLDGATFAKVDTKTVTAADVAYEFKQTFDDVGQKIWYRFEAINSNGEKTWYTTNTVKTVVNYDNATYFWRADGASGVWDDAANWTNSRNDSRLKWPTHEYTTADFSGLASGADVTVTVGAAHTPKMKFAPADASLTLKGESSVTLTMKGTEFSGSVTVDGMALELANATFGDGARLVAKNGAKVTAPFGFRLVGQKSGIEVLDGATLTCSGYVYGSGYVYVSGDSEIILNGGSVPNAGYFFQGGGTEPKTARIVFGPLGGTFVAPGAHSMGSDHVCTFRYELPGRRWTGYAEAPLQPSRVNQYHQFGRGTFHVEVVDGEESPASKELELPLIELPHVDVGNTIYTNGFSFAAFGDAMEVGVPNKKGDYFYWTYDGGDATEPATEGTLPSGLRFHHASRSSGMVITVR